MRQNIFFPVALALLIPRVMGTEYSQEKVVQDRQSVTVEFSNNGNAQIKAELVGGNPIEIIVKKTAITSENFPYGPNDKGGNWPGWGGSHDWTRDAVTAISVTVDDRSIHIPMSAYSDLAGAHHILFEDTTIPYRYIHNGVNYEHIDRPSFRLVVFGGNASGSYRAQLDFSTRFLERRAVWLGEFDNAVNEVTVYKTADPASDR